MHKWIIWHFFQLKPRILMLNYNFYNNICKHMWYKPWNPSFQLCYLLNITKLSIYHGNFTIQKIIKLFSINADFLQLLAMPKVLEICLTLLILIAVHKAWWCNVPKAFFSHLNTRNFRIFLFLLLKLKKKMFKKCQNGKGITILAMGSNIHNCNIQKECFDWLLWLILSPK